MTPSEPEPKRPDLSYVRQGSCRPSSLRPTPQLRICIVLGIGILLAALSVRWNLTVASLAADAYHMDLGGGCELLPSWEKQPTHVPRYLGPIGRSFVTATIAVNWLSIILAAYFIIFASLRLARVPRSRRHLIYYARAKLVICEANLFIGGVLAAMLDDELLFAGMILLLTVQCVYLGYLLYTFNYRRFNIFLNHFKNVTQQINNPGS